MQIVQIILGLFNAIWQIFADAAIYILFGIFIAGLLQVFVDKDKIARHLGRPGLKSVILSALLGVPLPLCSCGVIPAAVSLRKNGASKGAVLSFLISTPETGVDSIATSYALLDPLMTVFRPIAAFVTAIIAGIGENIFGKKNDDLRLSRMNTCDCCGEDIRDTNHKHGVLLKIRYGIKYAFVELLGDIAKWLVIGIIIGGCISFFLPQGFFNYLGSGWLAMLVMLLVGIPLYICASASTPIAAALILKGMSPGVALVFLLAGPATNAAGILTVGKFLGKRSAVIYLAAIALCSLSLGLLLNYIYFYFGMDARASIGKAGELFPYLLRLISAFVLIVLIINSLFGNKKLCNLNKG
jgi:uncharacterized membrane protein YraQ (UPF0718 family)